MLSNQGLITVLRTHTCGELRTDHVGQTVTLAGWVIRGRDHGGLAFIDLRDRYGVTQIVFNPDRDAKMHELARSLRAEDVIQVTGEVVLRDDRENEKLATGKIEVRAHELQVLNKSKTPPFEPGTSELPNEELRLTYRFLDLRSERLQEALKVRSRLSKVTRDYFDQNQFLEVETPILGRSTPEGARDYLVPSRVHEGSFYALPQSPQIYKQILMISGYDRYYQIARCFRDEDLRADRQPEFTQIDLEMAFVNQEDILTLVDGLIATILKDLRNEEIALPLPRYDYDVVMEKYGSDKPDLRFGLELVDVGEIAANCDFAVFKKTMESGGRVRGLNAKGAADRYSRKDIDGLTEFVGEYGAKGLAFFKVTDEGLHSPIAKFFSDDDKQKIMEAMGAEVGDLLFFVADQCSVTSAALSALRNRLGKELELYDPKDFQCCWVINFPLLSYNEEEQRWDAEHHPFCQPVEEDMQYLESDPSKVRAQSYDLVINGYELASGSVRVHDQGVQQQIFDLLGISADEAEERFGFLLQALRYGAPPHAGAALGLDRLVMLLCGNDNIRDVVAFPKTQKAADLLSGAPSEVDPHQLRDLRIKIDIPE
ncbi:aspartate--tRNA ligase [Gimesia alba]